MENSGISMRLRKKHSGFGVIGWIVMIPLLIIVALILTVGFYEGRKAYWDHKVNEMCEKDGGMRVYETVTLNDSEYSAYINQFGNFVIPRANNGENTSIISRDTSIYIHRNSPEVRRNELAVIRRSDEKVLGTRISYSRVGGDFIAFHPSIYRCPKKLDNLFSMVVPRNKEE